MKASSVASRIKVQLVLIRPVSRDIAVSRDSLQLPSVQVPAGSRFVPAIHSAVLATWGVRVFVLRRLTAAGVVSPIVAAELLEEGAATSWEFVRRQHLGTATFPIEACHELERLLALPEEGYVGAVGWHVAARRWVEETLSVQVDPDSGVEQFDGGTGFALLRFVSLEGHAYWLKATESVHRHELAITLHLGRLGSSSTPRVVAEHTAWNAWLMLEEGTPLQRLSLVPEEVAATLDLAVRALAEVQLRSLTQRDLLLAAGAFDQRLERLLGDAPRLFQYLAAANDASRDVRAAETTNSLAIMQESSVWACEEALALAMPSSLLHGDLNLGNLAFSRSGCRLLDWSESYVGFPLTSLHHLLLLNPIRDRKEREGIHQRLVGTYIRIMAEGIGERVLLRGLQLAPTIAAISALYGRGDWLGAGEDSDQRRYPFARAILRHLDATTSVLRTMPERGLPC